MSNHNARMFRLTRRPFIQESGTTDKEMCRLVQVPIPHRGRRAVRKAVRFLVAVVEEAEEAAMRVGVKAGMIRVQAATTVRAAITEPRLI